MKYMRNLSDVIGKWLLRMFAVWLIGGLVYAIVRLWPSPVWIVGGAPLILFGVWIFAISFD